MLDLACAHCHAIVHLPVTLGDGVTVCKPCVAKYRRAVMSSWKKQQQQQQKQLVSTMFFAVMMRLVITRYLID